MGEAGFVLKTSAFVYFFILVASPQRMRGIKKKSFSINSSLLTALPYEGAGRESSRGDSIGGILPEVFRLFVMSRPSQVKFAFDIAIFLRLNRIKA